jgi:hypothetical protein
MNSTKLVTKVTPMNVSIPLCVLQRSKTDNSAKFRDDLLSKKGKVKYSHYRPMGPRGFWEVKASRFRDIGT